MMNDDELMILYAKDRVVRVRGFEVQFYTKEYWHSTVLSVLAQLTFEDLPKIREIYANL